MLVWIGPMALSPEKVAQLLMSEHLRLRAYVWLIVRDDHLVDDVLQEVSLVAVRKCEAIVDDSHFPAWARTTSRNIALDMLRKEQRTPSAVGDRLMDVIDEHWDEVESLAGSTSVNALRHCLEELTPYNRRLIELRYGEGLKSSQVAERLDRAVGTVYVALTRVHKTLGDCVRGRIDREESDD